MAERIRIVPDLGEFTPPDGTLYRPSNGTEGEFFFTGWCAHCKNDEMSGTTDKQCPLIGNSMAFDTKHPDYPKEWIWQGGEPVCTAFDDVAERLTKEERAAQTTLPLEGA